MWYHRLERDLSTPSWRHFTEFVNTRFGPPLHNNPLDELASLRKIGSVSDFQEKFLALLRHADPQSEQQQMQLFTVSLGEPLKTDVEF